MIFEFEDTSLFEMARVGYFDDYEIYINTDDPGNYPHFHIRDATTRGQKFHTCIRIDTNRYFHHNGKEDSLNRKELKTLIRFLKSACRNKRYDTNWEYLVSMWNDNNSSVEIDENTSIPDYLNIID